MIMKPTYNAVVTAVLGLQWGDEGKAKVVDELAEEADIVVRFQGGPNAGHTIKIRDLQHILHQIPCGITRKGVMNVCGNGMVLNPAKLLEEIDGLKKVGLMNGELAISSHAHIIMPYHREWEKIGSISKKIDTTLRGIGPCYTDKVSRTGLRFGDFVSDPAYARERLEERVTNYNDAATIHNQILAERGNTDETRVATIFDAEVLFKSVSRKVLLLGDYITDTSALLLDAIDAQKRILAEGAQGFNLDLDHGTWPYVTSSSPASGGVITGLGIPPQSIGEIVGISKAYTTRVGAGPFPTELHDELGKRLRDAGNEYGATTGRPRRCGWWDAVGMRKAVRTNGVTSIALTKLDVLDGFNEIKICVGRDNNGEPIYETIEGWQTQTTECREYCDLPKQAIAYVERLSQEAGVPIGSVSVGPERGKTVKVPYAA